MLDERLIDAPVTSTPHGDALRAQGGRGLGAGGRRLHLPASRRSSATLRPKPPP